MKEGCTAGTTRKVVMAIAKELGMEVKTSKCELSMLKDADEVFLTNAIRGIQWIRKFHKKRYTFEKTKAIYLKMNELVRNSSIEI